MHRYSYRTPGLLDWKTAPVCIKVSSADTLRELLVYHLSDGVVAIAISLIREGVELRW